MSSPSKHHHRITVESPKGTTTAAMRDYDSDNDSVGPVLPLAATTEEQKAEPEPAAAAAASTRRGNAKTRARLHAAAASASTPSADKPPSPTSKKRKLGEVVESAAAASSSSASSSSPGKSKEHAAASRIQAMIRGAKARSAHKHATLWNAWNELDWKEEQALMNSHSAYEALKKAVTNRVEAEKSGKGKAGSKKRSASPSIGSSPKKGKGGKKASQMTPDEEESACGLLLRDKDPLTYTWVSTMMEHFRQGKLLPQSLVYKLLSRVSPILAAQPNLVEVQCTARITVVGDLHGQLDDLLAIFKLQGLPSARNRYLFNGDFVDRGQHSVECVLALFAWKILMPNDVALNRGNHEARDINGRDGFERECLAKYSNDVGVFDAFSKVFANLPLGHIFDSQVLVIHGGLFPDCPSLAEIQALDRFHEVPPSGSTMEYLLWSDPKQGRGREESPRGAGLLFGPDVTKEFLRKNDLQLLVRSHECMTHGYKMHHHDTVITVFSASNYCGTVGNDGALCVFERDGETTLVQRPKSRSSSPAMGASTNASGAAAAPASPSHGPMRSPRLAAKELAVPTPAAAASSAGGEKKLLNRRIFQFYAGE
jgi:serine/threonine-protein phosphatase 5